MEYTVRFAIDNAVVNLREHGLPVDSARNWRIVAVLAEGAAYVKLRAGIGGESPLIGGTLPNCYEDASLPMPPAWDGYLGIYRYDSSDAATDVAVFLTFEGDERCPRV